MRSTEDVEQIKGQITSLKELLRFDRQLCDEIEMLWQLLDENVELLLDVPNTRSVVEFLKNNSEQQYVLVEEYEPSAERARRFIESNELLTVTVVSLRALRGKFLTSHIVPYLPSNRNSDLLSSASATENFFLFLTDFEKSIFENRSARTNKSVNRLRRATASAFEGTYLSEDFKKSISSIKDDIKVEEPETDENVRKILTRYSEKYRATETKDIVKPFQYL